MCTELHQGTPNHGVGKFQPVHPETLSLRVLWEPAVVWMTGLPCSGKSTLSLALAAALHDVGIRAVVLDGDELRASVSADLGFGETDRVTQADRVAALARVHLEGGAACVISATISPYASARHAARSALGHAFVELHVDTPAVICAQRDVKGHWARAWAGELNNFTGVSAPYEAPTHPELVVHTVHENVEAATRRMVTFLQNRQSGFDT